MRTREKRGAFRYQDDSQPGIAALTQGAKDAISRHTCTKDKGSVHMLKPRIDVQKIRDRLLQERERTEAEIERLREGLVYDLEISPEEGDPEVWEREKTIALVRNMEYKLQEIERVLRLTERGDYGMCERCGQAIDPARLDAMPTATLCLKCKQELERTTTARIPGER